MRVIPVIQKMLTGLAALLVSATFSAAHAQHADK